MSIATLMPFLIVLLTALIPCVVIHSVILAALAKNGRTGWSFAGRYAVWGLVSPFAVIAALLVAFELLHAKPGWTAGVFVVMVVVISCVACIVSWSAVFLLHRISRLMRMRSAIANVARSA